MNIDPPDNPPRIRHLCVFACLLLMGVAGNYLAHYDWPQSKGAPLVNQRTLQLDAVSVQATETASPAGWTLELPQSPMKTAR